MIGIPRLARTLALVALALSTLGPALQAQAIEISGATLRETPTGAEVEIVSTAPPAWTARSEGESQILLELIDARPGRSLTNLAAERGPVATVVFAAARKGDRPSTEVRVTTREKAVYSVRVEGNVLTLRIGAAGAPEPAPAAPRAPATAPSSPAPLLGAGRSAQTSDPSQYRIAPGDVVSIDVFGVDEFDRETRVQGDGQIALPLLGRVGIAGLTATEAEEKIAAALREQQLVTQPQVLVVVEEYGSYGVTVQGAVVRPGVYPVLGRQSLLEVIWAAGGLSDRASPDQKILVLRQGETGQAQRIEVDAQGLLNEGDLSANVSLEPGDRVVVPKAQQFTVYVSGAVRRPGPVEFSSASGLTVLQAITLAGGPTERANLGKVTVIRQTQEGQETIQVNLKKIQKGKDQDLFLQNNDTIRVGVWFF